MSYFSVDNFSVGYSGQRIFHKLSFQLERGCIMGLLGANGCGKTTLLKALCGILPHEGRCRLEETVLEDQSARKIARLCSYVPQKSGISIDISVLDVVLMGFNPHLKLLQHPGKEMRQKARLALSQVGLAAKEETNYLHLSEGQKQLCILARTLVTESKLLLLDEPESALDFYFRHRMLEILHQRVSSDNSTAIVALHDPMLALNHCDKLLLLSDGGISGIITPSSDSTEEMERRLSAVYGCVSLHRLRNRNGAEQLVMLKEETT